METTRTDTTSTGLRSLVEQLEDARQFHKVSAQHSTGDQREHHAARSLAYVGMLLEIRRWELRHIPSAKPWYGDTLDEADGGNGDGYAALMERIYRIHSAGPPLRNVITTQATTSATGDPGDGVAMDGRQRAGSMRAA